MNFTSPELQKSFESAKPILEKITETKNRISNEIRNLENFFQSLDINESIPYTVTNPNIMGNINFEQFCGFSGGHGIATEELLFWDHIKKRILYIHNEYEASVTLSDELALNDTIDLDFSTLKTLLNRPLIETTFDIRKKMYESHLSNFITHVAKKFEVIEKTIETESDIPF